MFSWDDAEIEVDFEVLFFHDVGFIRESTQIVWGSVVVEFIRVFIWCISFVVVVAVVDLAGGCL